MSHVFAELSEKLENVFRKLRGQGRLTEDNVKDAMRDVRRSFLEADVNFRVAKSFISSIQEKSIGTDVLKSISPGQMIVKIVHDELVELLGGSSTDFVLSDSRDIIIICGLQGSGKTTTVVKLANYLKNKGKHPIVSSVDIHRPAALEQLKILSEKNNIPHAVPEIGRNPLDIIIDTKRIADSISADVIILDTAGRLHVDEDMMHELTGVIDELKPNHILFVADGMTGQDAVNAVEGFMKYVTFDGVVMTKMDGDARGGAALSLRKVTGKPILFVGLGERIDDFDKFYPERIAGRILGMGDIVSLVEKAQTTIDAGKAKKLQQKITSEGISLEDFLDQLKQIKSMGSIEQLMSMIPGVGKAMKGLSFSGDEMKHVEAIILSMTPEERKKPSIIEGSRRKRIALGSGATIHEVNNLLKQFTAMQKMIKKMSRFDGKMGIPSGIRMPF